MSFTLAFILFGMLFLFAFVFAFASIALGYEEDKNKNFIPDSWEFWNKDLKKKK